MKHKIPIPPPGFEDLSVDDKLDYIQSLWDHMTAKPEEIPIPDWHRHVLRERLRAYEASPEEGRPWEAVRDDLLRELRDREPGQ